MYLYSAVNTDVVVLLQVVSDHEMDVWMKHSKNRLVCVLMAEMDDAATMTRSCLHMVEAKRFASDTIV